MNIVPIKEYYIRSEVEKDVSYGYIFTDNYQRSSGNIKVDRNSWYYKIFIKDLLKVDLFYGRKTQAVIRSLNNAFPITTMVDGFGTQWNDKLFDKYKITIDFEIELIKKGYEKFNFKGIKYNDERQFGDGAISKMKFSAPKCWEYLNEKLLEINIINN